MADLLADASEWLAGVMKDHVGKQVTYKRSSSIVTLTATRGQSSFQLEDATGIVVRFESADFIFERSSLKWGDGTAIEPQDTDKIIVADGAKALEYELLKLPSVPCCTYDPDRKAVRVHAKLVKST